MNLTLERHEMCLNIDSIGMDQVCLKYVSRTNEEKLRFYVGGGGGGGGNSFYSRNKFSLFSPLGEGNIFSRAGDGQIRLIFSRYQVKKKKKYLDRILLKNNQAVSSPHTRLHRN